MWYMLPDENNWLYHYTKAETLTEHILPSGKLMFSTFENLNDPRESKDFRFKYGTWASSFSDHADLEVQTTFLNESIKRRWRIGCFVSDPDCAVATAKFFDEGRGGEIPQAAFNRGHSRPRMWAQYGDGYKGACLVFDKSALRDCVAAAAENISQPLYEGLITYENPRAVPDINVYDELTIQYDLLKRVGVKKYLDSHVEKFWRNLFFRKAIDWSQEHEYRFAVRGNRNAPLFVDIAPALKGILIGDRFPTVLKSKLADYLRRNTHVDLAETDWLNGFPQPKTKDAAQLA